MKSAFRILTAGALTLSLVLTSTAAALSPIRSFAASGFIDVPDDWSYPYILSCYELGLMSGQGSGIFAPNSTVSVAEGITVAARVHNLWNGGNGTLPESTPWYNSAVEYGVAYGLLTQGQFTDFSASATRAQLAGLLAKALPAWDYSPINEIEALPDVTQDTPYADSIFTLYRAGVLTGSDVYGTFSPDSFITRAELAAILCRLVRPETRQHLLLWEPGQTDGPVADQDTVSFDLASFDATLSGGSLMAVLFYADWCPPCHLLSPTIDQLASQYLDRAVVGKVDVDQLPELAQRYTITNYPTVIFFQAGQELERQIGIKELDTYANFLDSRL